MNTRERFHAVMNFKPFDRLPLLEWAMWWDKTIDRWHGEGLPPEITDRYDICRHFGLDLYKQDWVQPTSAGCPQPPGHGLGIISSEKDYDQIRRFLFPADPVNLKLWEKWAEEQAAGNSVLWFTVDGFFWFARTLLGIEKHLYAFYDEPGLMHRINADLAEWMITVIEKICTVCTPDFMTFAEDMSYNNGPMLSKDLFDEYMKPYYARVIPVLEKHGIFSVIDSDGDITMPAHWFGEAGLQGILPLERQSGVDINVLQKEHPGMRFIGHFDKMVMHKGEKAMREEFERLLPAVSKGGFLMSCDHQTPPAVSYRDYQLYLKLFREYGETAGRNSGKP